MSFFFAKVCLCQVKISENSMFVSSVGCGPSTSTTTARLKVNCVSVSQSVSWMRSSPGNTLLFSLSTDAAAFINCS